jgi:uncharacterized membrane protein
MAPPKNICEFHIPLKTKFYLHMKLFTNILVILALGLIVFNITLLDFENPLQGNSMVAFIGIAASICAVLILLIFRMSKNIEEKMNDKF